MLSDPEFFEERFGLRNKKSHSNDSAVFSWASIEPIICFQQWPNNRSSNSKGCVRNRVGLRGTKIPMKINREKRARTLHERASNAEEERLWSPRAESRILFSLHLLPLFLFSSERRKIIKVYFLHEIIRTDKNNKFKLRAFCFDRRKEKLHSRPFWERRFG